MEKGRCTPVRDVKKTVGAMAGRAKTAYLSYIDSQGYPTTRAMLPPREREGIRVFFAEREYLRQSQRCEEIGNNSGFIRKIPRGSGVGYSGVGGGRGLGALEKSTPRLLRACVFFAAPRSCAGAGSMPRYYIFYW